MQQRRFSRFGVAVFAVLFCGLAAAQTPASGPVAQTQDLPQSPQPAQAPPASSNSPTLLPKVPQTPREIEDARIAALGNVNGRPYDQPSHKDQFFDYLRDSYGPSAFARSTIRTLYSEGRGTPKGWGQDFPGFMQRFGSNVAITAIDGNVRFAMETVFSEDMRYIPCHGCSVKRKIVNALLSEVTARHDVDGHRFFTLTPAIADFSGPIIANAFWYPNHDPFGGVVGTRTVAATRVGQHLFTEFVWERLHHDPKVEDRQNDPSAPSTSQPKPAGSAVSTPPAP
jgi:hypothetical protein